MSSPVVETVMGIDIWQEHGGYATYDGMIELEQFDTLAAAREGARRYAQRTRL